MILVPICVLVRFGWLYFLLICVPAQSIFFVLFFFFFVSFYVPIAARWMVEMSSKETNHSLLWNWFQLFVAKEEPLTLLQHDLRVPIIKILCLENIKGDPFAPVDCHKESSQKRRRKKTKRQTRHKEVWKEFTSFKEYNV